VGAPSSECEPGLLEPRPLVRRVPRARWPRPTAGYRSSMATIVLRVRLLGGEHTDLTYEDPDRTDEDEVVEQVIEVLREESGVLRCRHGDRLVALYARGVASIEVAPRGAIV
jgi:hypothetical protein